MSIHKKFFSLLSANLLILSFCVSSSCYSGTTIQLPKLISEFEKNQADDNVNNKPLEKGMTDKQVLLNSIKEDIKLNSQFFKTDKSYTFKNNINQQTNQPFKSKDEIVENEFFKDNPIETFRTTVNPLDLRSIKDTEFGLLNEQLVRYGFDFDDYVKIYRTHSGQFVIANGKVGSVYTVPEDIKDKKEQDEYRARKFALDGYLKPSDVVARYSYTGKDGEWYGTESDAKKNYDETLFQDSVDKGKIKSSLFYYYNGFAYNAFSDTDNEKLKDQLTQGIHFDSFDDKNKEFKTFASDKENFWVDFKEKLRPIFDANIDKIVKYETKIKGHFEIKSGRDGDGSETTLAGVTSNSDGVTITNKTKKGFDITISNNMRGNFDEKRFKDLGSMGSWSKNKDWTASPCHIWEKASATYKFGNQELSINLDKSRHLSDSIFTCYMRDYPDSISSKELDVNIGTVTDKFITLSREKTGDKTWDGLVDMFSDFLNVKENTINYETLASEIANSNGSETAEVETIKSNIRSKQNVTNWRDDVKVKIFDKIFEHLKNTVNSALQNKKLNSNSHFFNDVVDNYSSGQYVFSLIEENRKFKTNLDKVIASGKDIIATHDLNIDKVENQKSKSFETSKENWQQFNYFNKTKMDSNITLRQKWFIYDKNDAKDADIKDIDNIEQSVLFDSEDDAKQWVAREGKTFLRKKYDCYFFNNPNPISLWMENEDEAINYIRSRKVKLDYTYIHKSLAKELEQKYDFETTFPLWSEIDTSGLYTVYGYKSLSTGKYLYYKSYDEAYNSYIKYFSLTTDVVETKENIYYYQYTKIIDNNRKINRKCKHNNTIESIEKCANEVYKVIKENEKNTINYK